MIFITRTIAKPTVEAKKLTRIAKRVSSATRAARKSGPVTVTVYKKD